MVWNLSVWDLSLNGSKRLDTQQISETRHSTNLRDALLNAAQTQQLIAMSEEPSSTL